MGELTEIAIDVYKKDGSFYMTIKSIRQLKTRLAINTKDIHKIISDKKSVVSNIGEVTLKYSGS